MDLPPDSPKPVVGLTTKIWLIILGVAFALSFVLGWFDDFTELAPDHSGEISAFVLLAFVAGVINAAVGWRLASMGLLRGGRFPGLAAIGFLMIGFLAALLPLMGAADFAHGLIDFPPSKTRSAREVLPIGRAWRTHGKGRSWNIRTMDYAMPIEITEDDYDFMLAHRSPGDHGTDADEISAQGWFCARVTVERAGDAVRVMHAGGGDLPKGSMILCPRAID